MKSASSESVQHALICSIMSHEHTYPAQPSVSTVFWMKTRSFATLCVFIMNYVKCEIHRTHYSWQTTDFTKQLMTEYTCLHGVPSCLVLNNILQKAVQKGKSTGKVSGLYDMLSLLTRKQYCNCSKCNNVKVTTTEDGNKTSYIN